MRYDVFNLIGNLITKLDLGFSQARESGLGCEYSFLISNFDTSDFTEKQYNEWTDYLDNGDFREDKIEIYFSYDKSGYDFWKNTMNDSNYTMLNIWLSNDFTEENKIHALNLIDALLIEIEDTYNHIKNK